MKESSANLELLRKALTLVPAGVEMAVVDLLRDLPLFSPDLEIPDVPPAVLAWRRALADADALFIASPEYGHSLPGALKNGIDWVIGSGELYGKVVATTAVVPHSDRGKRGLYALGQTLRAVDAVVVGEKPIVRGPNFEAEIRDLLSAVVIRARELARKADVER